MRAVHAFVLLPPRVSYFVPPAAIPFGRKTWIDQGSEIGYIRMFADIGQEARQLLSARKIKPKNNQTAVWTFKERGKAFA
ncbi:hypothetical protein [Paenibacillus sp. P22]|uniref:hypothetical protein n=1 Tax=Paenibacillus sp. P22 TaxID=483908 RepID=UPI000419D710|nr:hypothetical protein [Paenibacillus sp. P22]